MSSMNVEIFDSVTLKLKAKLNNLPNDTTIAQVKKKLLEYLPHLTVDRICLRPEPRGKSLEDNDTISLVKVVDSDPELHLYFKDLGPQVSWTTVFLLEYAGPLIIYPLFFLRLPFIYDSRFTLTMPKSMVVRLALACWELHYAKRLYETLFVHHFSHATMPLRNLIKNCSYYWGFAAFIAFHVNHPLYTAPSYGLPQVLFGFAGFALGELGNFFIHKLFSDLRPIGSKKRCIPMPTANPFTWLFKYVSVPNYTYEILAWFSFSVMTQCFPALLFTVCGAYQMAVWAVGKHQAYKREFVSYPVERKAIFPLVV